MGLLIDLDKSSLTFAPSKTQSLHEVENKFWFDSVRADIQFSFAFEPGSSDGVPPPKRPENWRVGIVMNVVYASLYFQYEGMKPISHEFTKPLLDSAADTKYLPFVHQPVMGSAKLVDPNLPNIAVPIMTPVRDVVFSPDGIREDRFSRRPDQHLDVRYVDVPRYGGILFTKGGAWIRDARSIVTLGIWCVAMPVGDPRKATVLGYVDPFSLVSSVEFEKKEGPRSLGVPKWSANDTVRLCRVRFVDRGLPNCPDNAHSRLHSGPGNAMPVLDGTTAVTTIRGWLERQIMSLEP